MVREGAAGSESLSGGVKASKTFRELQDTIKITQQLSRNHGLWLPQSPETFPSAHSDTQLNGPYTSARQTHSPPQKGPLHVSHVLRENSSPAQTSLSSEGKHCDGMGPPRPAGVPGPEAARPGTQRGNEETGYRYQIKTSRKKGPPSHCVSVRGLEQLLPSQDQGRTEWSRHRRPEAKPGQVPPKLQPQARKPRT